METGAAQFPGASKIRQCRMSPVGHVITATHALRTTGDCELGARRNQEGDTSVVPLTTSTVYSTKVHTITSCAPQVTNCPAHSTIVSTETVAVSTTICPVGPPTSVPVPVVPVPTVPGHGNNSTGVVVPPPASSHVVPPPASSGPATQGPPPAASTNSPVTQAPAPPACPAPSVTAITKSYTTVLTSVEYSTIEVPCPPTGTVPQGTGISPVPTGPANPPSGGNPPAGGNGTTPGGNPPPVTAGAASFAGSAVFAAVAGIAAFVLA
ncbi:hypothetical protein H634G_07117 [Metarhizium anisopliae BRIP 53293]|uniref:GPI anchored serine-rich protein n=1 Tax=Metarhizium anisopliae BRIP 53293 TaxID=1291518 RepID=A0A0D9NUC1_METAN|nr:hypothetical protein H634G_07117 [Metarhizium anisopliae BRIP 53293]